MVFVDRDRSILGSEFLYIYIYIYMYIAQSNCLQPAVKSKIEDIFP